MIGVVAGALVVVSLAERPFSGKDDVEVAGIEVGVAFGAIVVEASSALTSLGRARGGEVTVIELVEVTSPGVGAEVAGTEVDVVVVGEGTLVVVSLVCVGTGTVSGGVAVGIWSEVVDVGAFEKTDSCMLAQAKKTMATAIEIVTATV